jgi:hypothetical protein
MTIEKKSSVKADVDDLMKTYTLREGDTLRRACVAEHLGVSINAARFGTAVAAWRERLLELHNLVMINDFRGNWIVANPEEKIEEATRLRRHAANKLVKAVRIALTADTARLSEGARATHAELSQVGQVGAANKLRLAESLRES